jgi:hypothetical protein
MEGEFILTFRCRMTVRHYHGVAFIANCDGADLRCLSEPNKDLIKFNGGSFHVPTVH